MNYGSWSIFGQKLPEFGITEAIGGLLGTPKTTQGGSNLSSLWSPTQTAQTPQRQWSYDTTGTTTYGSGNASASRTLSGGGGSVLGTGTNNNQNNSFDQGGMENAANDQARIELEQALSEYDRQASMGQEQIGALEKEQAGTLSDIGTMRGRVGKEAATAKEEAESGTLQQTNKALSTAQSTQRSNRNILRALGILSSSAAGEMLTKPMTEYSTVAADLGTQLAKRKQQVDDWLMQRGQDLDSQVRDVQNKYSSLINNIRNDLRYNGEQRALAVRAAASALNNKIMEIKSQAQAYQQAAREYNNNILGQIAQIQLYQNPQADISGILSSMLNPGSQTKYSQTAAISQDEQKKKQLLSGY